MPHTPSHCTQRVARVNKTSAALAGRANDILAAAAITDHDGRPVAAINIAVPTTRWTLEKAEEALVPHVQLAATSISQLKAPRR